MQQYPNQGGRFAPTPQSAPVHRFQHGSVPVQPYEQQGWQQPPQQGGMCADCPHFKEASKRRRKKKSSLLTKALAFVGLITILVQLARYVVIPLLVYLNVLSGGVL